MTTGPLSMTSRKVALFTTGKSPLLALKAPLMFTAFLDMLCVWNTPKSTFKMVNEPNVASLHWSSETSAASGHSDCPTIISVDSSQPWSGIRSSTGTGISTERSSVFSYDVSLQHKKHWVLYCLFSEFESNGNDFVFMLRFKTFPGLNDLFSLLSSSCICEGKKKTPPNRLIYS